MSHPALEHLPQGWFHHGEQVLALLEQYRPQVIVELGTHRGASAIAMARVLQPCGGIVYCVDTWCGVPKPGRRMPLRVFECATNVVIAKVGARIRMIPATTAEAAVAWTGPLIDFLYVDADHSASGCLADLRDWTPHVRSGGLIAGDDFDHPKYPGVREAWELFSAETGWPLVVVPTENTHPPGMSLVWTVKP